RAERLLDGRHAVRTVVVVEVDVVGAEPLERGGDRTADVLGRSSRRIRAGTPPELGRDHDLVTPLGERAAEVALACAVAVRLGSVEERHAGVECRVDDLARAGCIHARAELVAAEPDDGHDEAGRADVPGAHLVGPSVSSFVDARRKASGPSTQGGRVPVGTWPTEDACMRRFAAGQTHNVTCGRGHYYRFLATMWYRCQCLRVPTAVEPSPSNSSSRSTSNGSSSSATCARVRTTTPEPAQSSRSPKSCPLKRPPGGSDSTTLRHTFVNSSRAQKGSEKLALTRSHGGH